MRSKHRLPHYKSRHSNNNIMYYKVIMIVETIVSLINKDDIIMYQNEQHKVINIITLYSYPPQTRINLINMKTNESTFATFSSKCDCVNKVHN